MNSPQPTFEQARAREEENRIIAHLPYARPLLGQPIVTLTWRHCLELTLARNAFFTNQAPELGDVFDFIWRLHPAFFRPDGTRPNLPEGARIVARWRCALVRAALAARVRRFSLAAARAAVEAWIDASYQDMPTESTNKNGSEASAVSRLSPRLTWFDSVVAQYEAGGHSRHYALDLGVALSFQMMRARLIASGEGARCVAPSDKLITFED